MPSTSTRRRETMTEAELQAAVLELLDLLGWRAVHVRPARTAHGWRTPLQGPTAVGFPDILAVRRDRVLGAELKSARGALTAEQERWLDDLSHAGVECHVWRPTDWTDGAIEAVLRLDLTHSPLAAPGDSTRITTH